jgi:hypothetical protein
MYLIGASEVQIACRDRAGLMDDNLRIGTGRPFSCLIGSMNVESTKRSAMFIA